MNMQKGKITIMNVIVFGILVLAVIIAIRFIAKGIDQKQIKKEVFDTIGVVRGSTLTDAQVREIITEVLEKKSLQPLEISVEFKSNNKVHYSYKYEMTVNYILFKHSEIVAVEDEMENYGG